MGPELLTNVDFSKQLQNWKVMGDGVELSGSFPNGILMSGIDSIHSSGLSQIIQLPEAGHLVLLTCATKTEQVKAGEKSWEAARVVLLSLDANDKPLYDRPHVLRKQIGSHDWSQVSKAFEIGPDISKVAVAIQLLRTSGQFWVKSLSLRPVALKPTFMQYRLVLLSLWLCVAIGFLLAFLRLGMGHWLRWLVLLLGLGIFLGVLMPEDLKESFGAWLQPADAEVAGAFSFEQLNDAQYFNLHFELPELDVFKLGHFVMFALLSFTLLAGSPYPVSTLRLMFYLVLLAAVTEVLQLFIPGRTAQVADIMIDSLGIALGFGVANLFLGLQMK